MSYREVMEMPVRAFWLMHSNITRCLAEKDLRSLAVASNSQSSEGIKSIRENLIVEMGEAGSNPNARPISTERDKEGFEFLRSTGGL